jgi:hypothetical protein
MEERWRPEMKKSIVFVAAFLLLHVIVSMAEASRPQIYSPPESLNLDITLKSNLISRSYAVLTVTLKSLVGNTTRLKLLFESSKDLDVTPKTAILENLTQGAAKHFDLNVNKTSTEPDNAGSWVRARVEFLPDYEAIMKVIATDRKAYPLESNRDQLLKSLTESKTKDLKSIQAKRFFFPSREKGRRAGSERAYPIS